MEIRKEPLVKDHYYHIFSRSISKYVIFNNSQEYSRMIEALKLYRFIEFNHSFSKFISLDLSTQKAVTSNLDNNSPVIIEIVAYCLMPTHIHLLLKQVSDNGISKYMAKALNCYARYFNTKHQRIGPLWAGRFKSVLVTDDEQLLHLTRYIHLNPTSAGLIKSPKDWQFSSYAEYVDPDRKKEGICSYDNIFNLTPKEYQKFVLDQKSYQQELSRIKRFLIDNYTG